MFEATYTNVTEFDVSLQEEFAKQSSTNETKEKLKQD